MIQINFFKKNHLQIGVFQLYFPAIQLSEKASAAVLNFAQSLYVLSVFLYTSQKNTSQEIICLKNIFLNFLFLELEFIRNRT